MSAEKHRSLGYKQTVPDKMQHLLILAEFVRKNVMPSTSETHFSAESNECDRESQTVYSLTLMRRSVCI